MKISQLIEKYVRVCLALDDHISNPFPEKEMSFKELKEMKIDLENEIDERWAEKE